MVSAKMRQWEEGHGVVHYVQGKHEQSLQHYQMSLSGIDKFSAGRTKCRSPMCIRT